MVDDNWEAFIVSHLHLTFQHLQLSTLPYPQEATIRIGGGGVFLEINIFVRKIGEKKMPIMHSGNTAYPEVKK